MRIESTGKMSSRRTLTKLRRLGETKEDWEMHIDMLGIILAIIGMSAFVALTVASMQLGSEACLPETNNTASNRQTKKNI